MAVFASITPYLSAGDRCKPVFFAGPCVVESRAHALKMAREIKKVFTEQGVADRLVYKSSFDKANRTSGSSFRGPGVEKGLEILSAVKDKLDLPIVTERGIKRTAVPSPVMPITTSMTPAIAVHMSKPETPNFATIPATITTNAPVGPAI